MYPRTSIPTGLVTLGDRPVVFLWHTFYPKKFGLHVKYTYQVTSCVSPTCHTVLAVGLVMGGLTTSLNFNGTEIASNAIDEMENKRIINATILLMLSSTREDNVLKAER